MDRFPLFMSLFDISRIEASVRAIIVTSAPKSAKTIPVNTVGAKPSYSSTFIPDNGSGFVYAILSSFLILGGIKCFLNNSKARNLEMKSRSKSEGAAKI